MFFQGFGSFFSINTDANLDSVSTSLCEHGKEELEDTSRQIPQQFLCICISSFCESNGSSCKGKFSYCAALSNKFSPCLLKGFLQQSVTVLEFAPWPAPLITSCAFVRCTVDGYYFAVVWKETPLMCSVHILRGATVVYCNRNSFNQLNTWILFKTMLSCFLSEK